jgi:hypothetical protein
MIYISLRNKLRIVQHEPLLKYGDKIGWDERNKNDDQGWHEAIWTNSSQLYLALKRSHVGVINSRLFKYTQQHTVCFTALDSAPP